MLATFAVMLSASQPLQCRDVGALVETARVREGQLAQKLVVFGVIAGDPDAELSITTPRPGLIAAAYVRAGEPVTKGAALFELDTSPVSAAQARQAEAAVAYERTRLERLRPLEPKGLVTAETIAATEKALADAGSVGTAR
jgi:multidrug efflux pump subunit AcrA (membrane-fusion protein)